MWLNRRSKAFTLIEMVVMLLVSTILFGACYLLLQLVQRSYTGLTKKAGEVQEVNSLRSALVRDYQRSRYILLHEEGITCYGDSLAVAYLFGQNVTRQVNLSERIDTFHVAVAEFRAKTEGKEVLSPGSQVESVTLTVQSLEDTFLLHMYRPFSATEKINITEDI